MAVSPRNWASDYYLYVIGPTAINPLVDGEVFDTSFAVSGNGYVIDENRLGWRWRVRAGHYKIGWGPWSEERTFDVEPVNTDCPSDTT